jgi:hypothetical protein
MMLRDKHALGGAQAGAGGAHQGFLAVKLHRAVLHRSGCRVSGGAEHGAAVVVSDVMVFLVVAAELDGGAIGIADAGGAVVDMGDLRIHLRAIVVDGGAVQVPPLAWRLGRENETTGRFIEMAVERVFSLGSGLGL